MQPVLETSVLPRGKKTQILKILDSVMWISLIPICQVLFS